MSDINDRIAALEKELAALRAAQATQHPSQDMQADQGGVLHHNRQVHLEQGASYHEAAPSSEAERAERALRGYLLNLRAQCRTMQLARIDDKEANAANSMRLEHVYVGLHVQRMIEISEEQEESDHIQLEHVPAQQRSTVQRLLGWLTAPLRRLRGDDSSQEQPPLTRRSHSRMQVDSRPLLAIEALNQADGHRLMLLGEPGSGKSTFVNFLTLELAESNLLQRGWLAQASTPAILDTVPGWSLGRPLPILVVLRDLAAYATGWKPKKQSRGLLIDFLADVLLKEYQDACDLLLDQLHNGNAILLFDGLDEVVGAQVLPAITRLISQTAHTYPQTAILVTCRVRDYQQNPQRQLPDVASETLAPFSKQQIEAFVQAWYRELEASKRQFLGSADALLDSINARPELEQLAQIPLLLTMMAIVHAGRDELPHARALLYDECIKLLLLRWRRTTDTTDVLELLRLPHFGPSNLLALMAQLGFLAHENAARTSENQDEPADLSREQVLTTLEQAFRPYAPGDEPRLNELVQLVLLELAGRNGLLLKRSGEGGEQYGFPHRTFQEFLAGDYIRRHKEYRMLALERTPLPHWHEALSLMVGYDSHIGNSLVPAVDLIKALLSRSPIEQTLAGELLLVIGRERLGTSYDMEATTRGGLWGQAATNLAAVAHGHIAAVPPALRVRAGSALGLLEYGSSAALARGALPPLGDPRLPLALVRWPKVTERDAWKRMWQHYCCPLEADSFWFGDDREEKPLQPMSLRRGIQIGRFPITNAEYAQFMAAGGYDLSQPWWTEHGRDRMQRERRNEPWLWADPRFNNALQPVVGVTWYEAAAYCGWLTRQGHGQGWLAAEQEVRLPTSLEWERAARHTDQRRYPWGNQAPTAEHANYHDTEIGMPSPVGCFPLGRATCGAEELAGNVMEWMATPESDPAQELPQKDFTQDEGVLLSYSDYSEKKEHLCCGARGRLIPYYGDYYRSFRVVLSLAHG